jgi:hypothetical protein
MSGISRIGGSGVNDRSVWLEKLREAKTTNETTSETTATRSATADIRGLVALKKEIRSAVSNALNELDKSASPGQVIKTIKEAVVSTLKANGIDVEAMKQSFRANAPTPPWTSETSEGSQNEMRAIFKELVHGSGIDLQKIKDHIESNALASPANSEDATIDTLSVLFSIKGVDTVA